MRTIPEFLNTISQTENAFTTNFLEIENRIERTRDLLERNRNHWTGEIKFLLWNATGLMPSLDRIVKRMEEEEILFCFVTETWLNPKYAMPSVCRESSAVCSVLPQGYDRGKNGVSMVINPKMARHEALKDTEIITKDTVNGTFLHVKIGGLNVICIYYPPSSPTEIDIWLEEILIRCNVNASNNLIILGDFNARLTEWCDHQSNSRGRCLKEFMERFGLQRVDTGTSPTFIKSTSRPQDGCSIVDHVFTNVAISECNVVLPFNSAAGHRPIKGTLQVTADTRNEPPKYKRILLENIRKTDNKERLQSRLESVALTNLRKIQILRNEILNTRSTGQKQLKIDELERMIVADWLEAGRKILGEKTAGKRIIKYEALQSPILEALEAEIVWETDENRLRTLMKQSEKEKTKLRKEKFDKFAAQVGNSPASDMMKVVSSMLRNRRKEQLALNSSPAALEEYKRHFEMMNKNELPAYHQTVEPLIYPMRDPDPSKIERHFSPTVIQQVLYRSQWNKAPGTSGLTYDILKCGAELTFQLISDLFKIFIETKMVPQTWKRSIVVPVPKKGDLCLIKNYRPISLTEPLRKIFEHCMLRYVNESIGQSFLTQGGFRTNHCCNDMIVVLQEAMLKAKGKIHVAFLDIRAAYDSVDRRILWRRCLNRGICPDAVEILKQLFDHNSSQVVVNGRKSNPFAIEAGVLQGSVLSPCLYSIFIDDLARELDLSHKINIGSTNINCTMYADDIALFADEAWKLQELLDICTKHAERNRYRFNSLKCESISDMHNEFSIHGQVMPSTEVFKYLGVEMRRKGLDHNAFVKRRRDEAIRAADKLIGMGMNLGGLPLKAAAILYKVFIRPKLEASMCILPTLKCISKSLESSQCAILRRILRTGKTASSTICRSLLQAPRMYQRLKWLRTRFIRRYDNVLEATHVLKAASTDPDNWISTKLRVDIYDHEMEKHDAWFDEMNFVHAETFQSTGQSLLINTSKKLAWFLNEQLEPTVIRPILNWILKRYPGRDPPRCSKCLSARATQDHIAACSLLLSSEYPEIPARFRPEKLLSTRPEIAPKAHLNRLAVQIALAVSRSIPEFDFEILSSI